jgi:hypothetical protein
MAWGLYFKPMLILLVAPWIQAMQWAKDPKQACKYPQLLVIRLSLCIHTRPINPHWTMPPILRSNLLGKWLKLRELHQQLIHQQPPKLSKTIKEGTILARPLRPPLRIPFRFRMALRSLPPLNNLICTQLQTNNSSSWHTPTTFKNRIKITVMKGVEGLQHRDRQWDLLHSHLLIYNRQTLRHRYTGLSILRSWLGIVS